MSLSAEKIKAKIKKQSSDKIFTFFNNEQLPLFLKEVKSLDLMEFSSPELLLRNFAKVFQEGENVEAVMNSLSGFKLYAEVTEDSSLLVEINKEPALINWWKIESYFNTLADVLNVPIESDVKPHFPYKQMDMRRFVSQNKGRADLGEAVGRQYARREYMSDVIQSVIFEDKPFDSLILLEDTQEPLLSIVSSIVSGNTEEGGGISERKALAYIKKNIPHAYEYLNSVFDLESFCCGEIDEKIFSKRQKITPLETSTIDVEAWTGLKK